MADLAPEAPFPAVREKARGEWVARFVIIPLTLIFAVIVIVFYVVFSAVGVEGDSMLPSIRPKDQLLRTRGYSGPVRGDIVIVDLATVQGREEIVKRVIAIPGDLIEIREDVAYVNGVREDTSERIVKPDYSVTLQPYRVPRGTIFVMGDNRPVSMDSRFIGAVPLSEVQGRAVAVYAPIQRARLLH